VKGSPLLGKVKPRTPGQERLVNALLNEENMIVGVFGPTGTGKSLISAAYALDALERGLYSSLIICRPVVDVASGRELTAVELGELYYRLASEYLSDLLTPIVGNRLEEMFKKGKILVADSHFLKGRTFNDSIVFFDDIQNAPPENVVEVVSRIGDGSKLIVAGDPVLQRPPTPEAADSVSMIREILLGEQKAAVIDLGIRDMVRPGARIGLRFTLELKMRKRSLKESEARLARIIRDKAPDTDVITAVEFKAVKEDLGVRGAAVPDVLVIVKEGYLGRLVGRGGERITAIEKESGLRIRAVELTLDLKNIITAIHPVSWIGKHIKSVDFAGPRLLVEVSRDKLGAFIGQGGSHVKLVDAVFKELIGVEVEAQGV